MDVSVTLDGITGDDVDAFIVDVLEHCLRPAAHAGALTLYNEARTLVPVQSGLLRDSIYRVHVDDLSSTTQQIYEISWNHSKAPHGWNVENGHWRTNQVVRTEDGRWVFTKDRLKTPVWVPQRSFIRRAFVNKAAEAVAASQQRLAERYAEMPNRD